MLFVQISWKQKKPSWNSKEWHNCAQLCLSFELEYDCWGCCFQVSECHLFSQEVRILKRNNFLDIKPLVSGGDPVDWPSWVGNGGHGLCHQFDHTPQVKSFSSGLFESDFESLSCDLWCRFPGWEIGGFSWKRWVLSDQFGGGCRLVPWPNITPALLLQWTLLLQCSHSEHLSSTRPLSQHYSEHNSYITPAVNKTRSLAQYHSERYFCITPTVNPTLPFPRYYSKQYAQLWTLPVTCDDSLMNICALNVPVLNVVVPLMSLMCASAEHYLWVKVI